MVGVTQIHKIVRKVVCQKTKKYAFLQFQIRQVGISGWQPCVIKYLFYIMFFFQSLRLLTKSVSSMCYVCQKIGSGVLN